MMQAVGFSRTVFVVFSYTASSPMFLKKFYEDILLQFVKGFSALILILWILSLSSWVLFHLLMWMCWTIPQSLSRLKPIWLWWVFNVCLYLICRYFIGDFWIYVFQGHWLIVVLLFLCFIVFHSLWCVVFLILFNSRILKFSSF